MGEVVGEWPSLGDVSVGPSEPCNQVWRLRRVLSPEGELLTKGESALLLNPGLAVEESRATSPSLDIPPFLSNSLPASTAAMTCFNSFVQLPAR